MRNVRKPNRFVEWVSGVAVKIQCSKCEEIKDACKFNKNNNHSTKHNSSCKECDSLVRKDQYLKNRENIKKRVNKYRLANIEKIKQKKSQYNKVVRTQSWWKAKHSDKRKKQCKAWRNKNNEHVKKYNKKYKEENKELCLRITKRRISSKRTQCLNLPIELKDDMAEFSLIVRALNKIHGKRAYHVDHIIPLKHKDVCGLHVPQNLQILTAEENSSKNNKFDGTYENESWREDL